MTIQKTQGQDKKQHSRMGIASMLLPLVMIVMFFVMMIGSIVLGAASVATQTDPTGWMIIFLIIGIVTALGTPLSILVGLGLGIAGAIQKEKKRITAYIGLGLNGLLVIGYIFSMVAGAAGKY